MNDSLSGASSTEWARACRRTRGEQALADLVATARWVGRHGRHLVVDRAVDRWFTLPTEIDSTDAGDLLRWAPTDDTVGADPWAVVVSVADVRGSDFLDRPVPVADRYATLWLAGIKWAHRIGWKGPNPWYSGLKLTEPDGTSLFWRGQRDVDVEVEVLARTAGGEVYEIVRTTTGWRLGAQRHLINAWSAFGARWDDRSTLYRSLHTPPLSTLVELHSQHLDAATIAAHLTDAGIFPGHLVINGQVWAPKNVVVEPTGRR